MTDPVKALACLPENLQPGVPVIIRQINVVPSIAARSDVVNTACQFKS
jgi:hypothetical protein